MSQTKLVALTAAATLALVAAVGFAYWLGTQSSESERTSVTTTYLSDSPTTTRAPSTTTTSITRLYGEEGRVAYLAAWEGDPTPAERVACWWDLAASFRTDPYIETDRPQNLRSSVESLSDEQLEQYDTRLYACNALG